MQYIHYIIKPVNFIGIYQINNIQYHNTKYYIEKFMLRTLRSYNTLHFTHIYFYYVLASLIFRKAHWGFHLIQHKNEHT